MKALGLGLRLNLEDPLVPRIAASLTANGAHAVGTIGSFVVGSADTDYLIYGNAFVSSYTNGEFQVWVNFTDESGDPGAGLELFGLTAAGVYGPIPAGQLTGGLAPVCIRAKAGTTVTITITEGGAGSVMTFNARIIALQMSGL